MVNGVPVEDELQRIDKFFDDITIEEFEDMSIKAGIKARNSKTKKRKCNENDKLETWLKKL